MISVSKKDGFSNFRIRTLKTVLFVLLCVPAINMGYAVFMDSLADPIKELTLTTGEWAMRILLMTLAISSLRRISGWGKLVRLRRMLGLFSFFYMTSHFLIYLILDRYLFWPDIISDFTERPYIIAGLTCLVLCIPLALTSTDGMIRRLGGRLWKRLHKLIYVASIAAILHFVWLVKSDYSEPIIYAVILFTLFFERIKNTNWPSLSQKLFRTTATPN